MTAKTPIALVTGGGSGIGAAACRSLSEAGHRIVVADIDDAAAGRLAQEVSGKAVHLDVADPASWQQVAQILEAKNLLPQAVVLNAGLGGGGDVLDLDQQRYRRLLAVNVDGVVYGLATFGPVLAGAGRGSITVTASLAGLTAVPFDPVYALTKHAVIGLVRSCSHQLAEQGVRLQAVCPGLVETPLLGQAKEQLDAASYPLLSPERVATVLTECVVGDRIDEVIVMQFGCDPMAYRFAGVPGPRGATTSLPDQIDLGRLDQQGVADECV